ncbi:sensor histidine kinase [Paraflavitalea pollutisoli]|uniref:sensor histidine kinase n=1 Tax=Paraflavitalea pollutisoli TaxID=3034143 RepID=UPI0023EE1290|nr:sensor histidine kinase [Paraflavitalea sp. H1-2-19X]
MFERFNSWSYSSKSRLVEILYLFILSVIVPFSMGWQIFDKLSFILSLVLLSILETPSIMLFYRWLLPRTLFSNRVGWFLASLPAYIVIYELNIRAAYLLEINLPIIPAKYQSNLASVNPWGWSGRLIQNMGYTVLIMLTAVGVVFFRELFKRQHLLDQLQTEKLRLELDQLKSQIQPHFFFNTLNNLYSLSLQGSPKTSVSIANLSGIMRYVLYEARDEKVLLAKEIAFLHSYLELERIRHNDENLILFGVQGNPASILIEPLLFLPLIENCFKHSLQYKIPGNQVQVFMTVDDEEITFQTSNLIAPREEVPAREGGIGLYNVRKRLELLYPSRHQLLVSEEDSRFIVTLSVQLKPAT